MNILTPTGYIDIATAVPGTELLYYDLQTGELLINELLAIEQWTKASWSELYDQEHLDPNPFTFYLINGTWKLFKNQSIWRNLAVCHIKDLQVGDVVYDGDDNDITITSIQEVAGTDTDIFWHLRVSGDHSYIVDNITLHNATRYAKAAGGNWSAAATWSATSSADADSAGAPTSSDDTIFDTGANTAVAVDTTACAAKTLTCQSAANAITFTSERKLAVSGNVTFYAGMTLSGTGMLATNGSYTLTTAGLTFPGSISSFNSPMTLVSALTVSGTLTVSTVTGAYDITCGVLDLGYAGAVHTVFPAGITVTVASSFHAYTNNSYSYTYESFIYSYQVKSGTASSPFYLVYQGTPANCNVCNITFTDVDASGSAQGIDNWYGGTLTRCTNITNRTSADIGGGSGVFMPRARQIGV